MSSVDSKVRMLSRLIILWSTRESSKIETRVAGGGGGGKVTKTNHVLHIEAPPSALTPYPFIYTF